VQKSHTEVLPRCDSDCVCLRQGLDFEDAAKRFWILDKNGLITRKRPDEELTDVTRPFAAIGEDDIEGESLLDVVKRVSPTPPQLSFSEVDALL
jgi:hypothetical protein